MEKRLELTGQMRIRGTQIIVTEDYESLSRQAAEIVTHRIREKPNALLCAATGNTPIRTYQIIGEAYREDPNIFKELRILKLDEWGGLDIDHPATCEVFIKEYLLKPLEIGNDRYLGCLSNPENPEEECSRMNSVMDKEGPIDLCLLGLGHNGHLGLIEPSEQIIPHWHVANLSSSSLDHSMLQKYNAQPSFGITLGMGDLLRSKHILLLVSGFHKKGVLKKLLNKKVSTSFPASFLWLHSNVTILCDQEAAVSLQELIPDVPVNENL